MSKRTSTLTVDPLEEKVDVLDRAELMQGKTPTNWEYFMKFVCAAMSSECASWGYAARTVFSVLRNSRHDRVRS